MVQPAFLAGGCDHRIFAGHLIGNAGHTEFGLCARQYIKIGHARLHDHNICTFRQVQGNFVHGLVAIGRVHLICGLAVRSKGCSGAYSHAERAIETRRIFCCIGHDLHILVASTIKCGPDCRNASIHHVGRGNDIAPGIGLKHRLFAQNIYCFVIGNFTVAQHAVMAVGGERVEGNITHDAQIGMRIFYRACCAANQIVAITGK